MFDWVEVQMAGRPPLASTPSRGSRDAFPRDSAPETYPSAFCGECLPISNDLSRGWRGDDHHIVLDATFRTAFRATFRAAVRAAERRPRRDASVRREAGGPLLPRAPARTGRPTGFVGRGALLRFADPASPALTSRAVLVTLVDYW
ncbi:hypothetical protein GCM10009854_46080 [Saccharopolyspora halophila]|uniref:Uncharacterized protein n=1 Tax=Saccharopolyspora halophila TaxID=405551 RepID=A0ABN3GW84_9PSEU